MGQALQRARPDRRLPGGDRARPDQRGDEIRVLEVPAHGVSVPQSFRALMGDRDLAGQILASGAGSETLRAELEGRQ